MPWGQGNGGARTVTVAGGLTGVDSIRISVASIHAATSRLQLLLQY